MGRPLMQIDLNKVAWDAPAAIPLDRVKWDAEPSLGAKVKQGIGNAAAGVASGFADIGDTLLNAATTPLGAAVPAVKRWNDERTSSLDAFNKSYEDSTAFTVGRVGGNVLATLPVGGALGAGAKAAGAAPQVVSALTSSGMNAGGLAGRAGLSLRLGAGAATGGASAALVSPDDAAPGMAVGAVAPAIVKGLGAVGVKLGDRYASGIAEKASKFAANGPLNKTIQESVEAGYLLPPSSVNPSTKNRVLESISGKQATQQIVSTKNSEVTANLVREALGIPVDTPLSAGTLENLRKTAGKAYAEVSALSPAAAADLEALKTARNEATGWFKAYNRSARPDDLAKAKEARALSDQLEGALEGHAAAFGKSELIPALRDARTQIAKTYTVGRALNDASGTVDARILGRMREKGVPLTNELATVARFGSAFPTAAKTPQQVGSPGVHNLNALASVLLGGGGMMATGDGSGAAAAVLPFVTAPAARAMLLRRGAQNALVPKAPQANALMRLMQSTNDPNVLELFARAAPALVGGGGP